VAGRCPRANSTTSSEPEISEEVMAGNTTRYISLMQALLDRQISASQFSEQFMGLFKREEGVTLDDVFHILDRIFVDADAYDPDNPSPVEPFAISEDQLRSSVAERIERLKSLAQGSDESASEPESSKSEDAEH
jgi:hypothetical protein